MIKTVTSFALFCMVWVPLAIHAQGPDIEEHQVVTAQFLPESAKDSIYRVKVLDRKRIEASGARSLDELLATELNLTQTRHRIFGSSLELGGLGSEHLKILQDGVPIVGRLEGKIDLGHLRLDTIERVEIIEGPVSVYYGTDALGGVVNLITRDPGQGRFHGAISTTVSETRGWGRGAEVTTTLGSVSLGVDGFTEDFSGENAGAGSRIQTWPSRNQDQAGLVATTPVGTMLARLRARHFQDGLTDAGEALDGTAVDTRYQTRRYQVDLQVQGNGPGGWYFDWQAALSDYRRDRDRLTYAVSDGQGQWLSTEHGLDPVDYRHQFLRALATKEHHDIQWQFGAERSTDRTAGSRILQGTQTMGETAVFAGFRWQPLSGFTVQPAFRWTDHTRYDVPITPALNLHYRTPAGWSWRANYSRGFRGPSLKELYLDFAVNAGPFLYHITGNPALRPERANGIHMAVERDWQTGRFAYRLEGQAHHNRVENLIALSQIQPIADRPRQFERHYINVDDQREWGSAIHAEAQTRAWKLRLGLGWTATDHRFDGDDLPGDLDRLDGSFQLGWQPQGGPWALDLFGKIYGTQPGLLSVDQNGQARIVETRVPGYTLIDLTLRWAHPENGLRFTAAALNLADVERRDVLTGAGSVHQTDLVNPGRSLRLTAAWSW